MPKWCIPGRFLLALSGLALLGAAPFEYDVLIINGMVYDGSGGNPFRGEVAIRGDRIVYVGARASRAARRTIDAEGRAVAPGFINMLAHPEETLLVDGRALSDLRQGVTLEIMGESSMGPLTPDMKRLAKERQTDITYPINWTTLDEYLEVLQRKGIAPNVASFVSQGTVRTYVLGERDVQPTLAQLKAMKRLVASAMEDGALGLTTALEYTPNRYARTPELIALAGESARCGGMYIAHMRNESDRLIEAVDETIEIAKRSGGPAEIYHLKVAGKGNWAKLDPLIRKVDVARASGTRITANMYTYTRSASGLDLSMPPWVQEGGIEAWVRRLKDPATRTRVIEEMRAPSLGWSNSYRQAGADGVLLLAFKTERLKSLTGKTLAEVARMRGVSPEDAAVDLVIEDGTRIGVAYSLMSEENVRRQVALPWVSFGSDEGAPAPAGVFLRSSAHPRAYGNFARLFAKYVREDRALSIQDAVRKLTSFPADTLSLFDRGRLRAGAFADIVIFDPATIQDHATFDKPHQLATGVRDVLINGRLALSDGQPTGLATGRVVRGRGWKGAPLGGCRGNARQWRWSR